MLRGYIHEFQGRMCITRSSVVVLLLGAILFHISPRNKKKLSSVACTKLPTFAGHFLHPSVRFLLGANTPSKVCLVVGTQQRPIVLWLSSALKRNTTIHVYYLDAGYKLFLLGGTPLKVFLVIGDEQQRPLVL